MLEAPTDSARNSNGASPRPQNALNGTSRHCASGHGLCPGTLCRQRGWEAAACPGPAGAWARKLLQQTARPQLRHQTPPAHSTGLRGRATGEQSRDTPRLLQLQGLAAGPGITRPPPCLLPCSVTSGSGAGTVHRPLLGRCRAPPNPHGTFGDGSF